MGGSGDYFDVADTVIAMQDFQPQEMTAQAQAIAQQYVTDRTPEGGTQFGTLTPRFLTVQPQSDDDRPPKRKVRDLDTIVLGHDEIDLSAVEQIAETGQLRAIAAMLIYLQQHYLDGTHPLTEVLDYVMADLAAGGFDHLTGFPHGDFAHFRRFELAAALNRWRSLHVNSAM